ncbi:MAG: S53 family peptidase, partial [Terriglobales bacterium]
PNAPADKKYLAAYVRAMQTGKRPKLPSSGRNASANVQWTWETTQGIELVGAFANAAKVVVYFGQNSEAGRYRVLARAIRDEVQQASVLCCSWHIGFEEEVRREERTRLNALFREAGRRGVTICTASGDWGDGTQAPGAPKRNAARVCFPASSPHVLACGGSSQILEEKKGEETVWSEIVASMQIGSGGGVSRVFGLPLWQQDAAVISKTRRRGRGVPDVAAKADLEGGYFGILGGVEVRNGGTSAAAPLWASLIAILNQALGVRLGFVNPLLYHPKVRRSLRAVVLGQAGQRYHASRGWNPCTGLGTPIVVALLRSLRKHGLAKRGA